MITKRARILFCAAFVLCISTAVLAMPTAVNSAPTLQASSVSSNTTIDRQVADIAVPDVPMHSHVQLARIGKQYLAPAVISNPLATVTESSTVALPAAPAAILMGLFGFLCVSAVKDRRFYVAVFVAIMWAGQAGVLAVPKLARNFRLAVSGAADVQARSSLTQSGVDVNRERFDIEGLEYIGLLHRLAGIPADDNVLKFQNSGLRNISANSDSSDGASVYAMINNVGRKTVDRDCYVSADRQFFIFNPAFIFEHLSRGPPA